jgi:hypothetical protein
MEQMIRVTLIMRTPNNAQNLQEIAMTMDRRRNHQPDLAQGDLTFHAGIVIL